MKGFNDPRITIIQNVTNHGNIGFNKHTIAMMCNGDFLVEVDHDDELTFDCLEKLHDAFIKYPDTDFVYSLTAEFKGDSEDPGPGKSNLPLELPRKAGHCSRVTAGPIDLI